ncbi:MAG TPA: iron-sulfur cluster assembly scaffold protein, partial [Erythrobacter sp.]|nr:iron-sulfur cluster assembly scaffold protein [Erythrobacter sp.]
MATHLSNKLYSPALLALAADLARYPFAEELPLQAEARSRTCGSVITVGLAQDDHGLITRIGMQVSACAIGQASAALLAQGITGTTPGLVRQTASGLSAWLAGEGELPQWRGIDALAPARDHPGRHGA